MCGSNLHYIFLRGCLVKIKQAFILTKQRFIFLKQPFISVLSRNILIFVYLLVLKGVRMAAERDFCQWKKCIIFAN
ncbi:MAG: hypothetical protein LBL74_03745 [Bacteroidales bacterium]|nr:hypothetical protein [Bacteroidales bacterium]